MTPQQALQLLDQVTASVHLSRNDHVKLQQAVSVLTTFIQEKTLPVSAKGEKKEEKK